MEVNLVRITKNGSTTAVPLAHDRTLIGRLDECHIRVPVAGMSRRHCEIVIDGGSVVINDLGSSNGTYVNQERIAGSQPLCAGDLISFGGLVFYLSVNGEPSDIDAEMMYEDGLPDEAEASAAPPAPQRVEQPVIASSSLDNDDSSMMDFDFDFDDDDDQPPL
ncbi:MAG: FHA domain-containing protein [Phycisphaerales bacterium]